MATQVYNSLWNGGDEDILQEAVAYAHGKRHGQDGTAKGCRLERGGVAKQNRGEDIGTDILLRICSAGL